MDTTVKEKPIRLGELQDYARELANRGIVSEGTCSTAADTAAKTVTLGTTFKFESGATFLVKFTNAISVASSTLAVTHTDPDGVTTTETAKPIYYRGAALPSGKISAGDNIILRYDGTSYNVIGTLAQDFTETDPVFSASAAAGITSGDIDNWNSKTSNVGTITGITMNGSSKGTSGVVDLGTVITSHQSVTDNNPTLSWGNQSKVATIGSTDINVTMPANPNTDTTYKFTIGSTTRGDSGGTSLGTLDSEAAESGGTDLSLVTTGEKNTWNNKQDALEFNSPYNASTNKAATMADVPTTMSASGTNHKGGLVPDPGATQGTTKFLREDGTWQVPAYPTIEDFHEAVATLSAAPTSSTLTYTRDGQTYNYKIGDQVRVHDTEKGTAEGNYYVFYTLKDKSNNTAYWEESGSGGGSVSVMGKIRVNLRAYVNDVLSQGTDLNGAEVTLTNTTNNVVVDTQTWAGTTLIFNDVTPMKAYSISVSAKTGYTQPAAQTIAELPFSADETLNFDYEADEYTASIQSNQGTDSGISSAQITIAGTALSDGGTVKVAKGTTISPTASAVTGYSSSVSVSGKTVTATYSTMILTVVLASDTGEADLSNVTITVTDTTDSTPLSPFATKQYKIPSGHTYSVAVSNDVDGYSAPASATGTATSGSYAADSVTMTYEEQRDFVDLGLSVKWAKGNICKNGNSYYVGEPTDKGCYYSWGNIIGHNKDEGYNFNSSTYNSTPGASLTANIASNDSAHDAALACLGTGYRMPTKAEFDELISNCDVTWVTSYNGVTVAGRVFKSKKAGYTDSEIFIPASGYYNGTTLGNEGSYGYYWSSTYYNSSNAYSLNFNSSNVNTSLNGRYYGFTVRAVQ